MRKETNIKNRMNIRKRQDDIQYSLTYDRINSLLNESINNRNEMVNSIEKIKNGQSNGCLDICENFLNYYTNEIKNYKLQIETMNENNETSIFV